MKKGKFKNIAVTKKGKKIVVSDKNTGIKLYQLMDTPTYANFYLDNPVLSGIASINMAGNSFSFYKYLSQNDDRKAIRFDWEKVGATLWDVCILFQKNIKDEKQTAYT